MITQHNKVTNRTEWNNLATKTVSDLCGGFVELTLMNDKIGIYTEDSKEVADKALHFMQESGCSMINYVYYESDEDGDEAWVYHVTLGE